MINVTRMARIYLVLSLRLCRIPSPFPIIAGSDSGRRTLLSYQEYQDLMRDKALAAHRDLVSAMSQEAERQGLTEEQLMAELEDVKHEVIEDIYSRQVH